MASGGTTKMKFPIINDLEFFDVLKGGKTILTLTNKEIPDGTTWRQLSIRIGQEISAGTYNYSFKLKNNDVVNRGLIRVVTMDKREVHATDNNFQKELLDIKNQLSNAANKKQDVSVDLLISITKQSYETQIQFLNNELQRKEKQIEKLESEIDKLNDELDKCDDQIEDLKAKTGIGQYLELAQTFLNSKIGSAKKITSLKDSSPDDIPEQILKILGAVDWTQVSPEVLDNIIKYLEIFITKLPLKGK
jgi:hypothetical protein